MNGRSLASSILLVCVALVTEVLVLTSATGPLRVVLGLAFVLVAPGWAILRLLALPMGVLAMTATAIGISVSIDILLSLALFYARWWSVEIAMSILATMIAVLVLMDLPIVRGAVRRQLMAPDANEVPHP